MDDTKVTRVKKGKYAHGMSGHSQQCACPSASSPLILTSVLRMLRAQFEPFREQRDVHTSRGVSLGWRQVIFPYMSKALGKRSVRQTKDGNGALRRRADVWPVAARRRRPRARLPLRLVWGVCACVSPLPLRPSPAG